MAEVHPWWIIETEVQWLSATHCVALTNHTHCQDARRRRLLACAAFRCVTPHLGSPVLERASELAEGFADGERLTTELAKVRAAITAARQPYRRAILHRCPEWHAYQAAECLTRKKSTNILGVLADIWSLVHAFRNAHGRYEDMGFSNHCEFARDIFGNPFRPVAFDPAWRTDTALSLARVMYETRDFAAMPILADALQEAGCEHADVLDHCRDPNATHVRGCWVVDLVLGKG